MLARRDLILARYGGVDVSIPPAPDEVELDSLPLIAPIPPIVVPVVAPVSDSLLDSLRVQTDTAQDTTRIGKN